MNIIKFMSTPTKVHAQYINLRAAIAIESASKLCAAMIAAGMKLEGLLRAFLCLLLLPCCSQAQFSNGIFG